ncbi:MAG: tetratricopeptide repeat protein [Alphaproteobacteria bacterium]
MKAALERPFFQVAGIVLIGLLAYSNTFNAPFQFDDDHVIERNPLIEDVRNFFDATRRESLIYDSVPLWGGFRSRAVVMFTFALNYLVHGRAVTGYHIVNTTIHIVNAVLVWLLARQLLSPTGLLAGGVPPRFAPFFAALLFVTHPIQTQAVTYVSQRFTSLAALFYLLSVVTYIVSRRSAGAVGRRVAYGCSLVAAVLAMRCKENAFTLIVTLAMYEGMFEREAWMKRIARLTPFACVTVILAWLSIGAGGTASVGDAFVGLSKLSGSVVGLSRWQYLMTEARVVVTYLRLLVAPVGQNLDYDYPLSRSLFEPETFASAVALVALFGAGCYALWRSRETVTGLRVIAFGIFWWFVTLSVESSVIPIADVIAEHRVYLPSVGLFIAALAGVVEIRRYRWGLRLEHSVVGSLAVIVIALAGATYARNAVWGSKVDLWSDVARKSPRIARPHTNLGIAYQEAGRLSEAIREFRIALTIDPNYTEAHQSLAVAYDAAGFPDEALREMQIVSRLEPQHGEGHYNLGILYDKLGRYQEATKEYEIAVRLTPYDHNARCNLGIDYARQGRMREAIEELERSIRLRRENPVAYSNLGLVYENLGRNADAKLAYRAALSWDPGDERARRGLERIGRVGQ